MRRILITACLLAISISASPVSAATLNLPDDMPTSERLAAMQLAIVETLRLKTGLCGGLPQDCEPQPPCDAQGRRPNGNNCTLVWKSTDDNKGEFLTWVEDWEAKGSINSHLYRLPTIGQDGKMY